jgi:chemotaxis response regulator CheB
MPRTARERKAAASILPPAGIAEALVRRGRMGG